jgi:hypothetical protein
MQYITRVVGIAEQAQRQGVDRPLEAPVDLFECAQVARARTREQSLWNIDLKRRRRHNPGSSEHVCMGVTDPPVASIGCANWAKGRKDQEIASVRLSDRGWPHDRIGTVPAAGPGLAPLRHD